MKLKDFKYADGTSFNQKLQIVSSDFDRTRFSLLDEGGFEQILHDAKKDGTYDKNETVVSFFWNRKNVKPTIGRLKLAETEYKKWISDFNKQYNLLFDSKSGLKIIDQNYDWDNQTLKGITDGLLNLEKSDVLKKAKATIDSVVAFPTVELLEAETKNVVVDDSKNDGIVEDKPRTKANQLANLFKDGDITHADLIQLVQYYYGLADGVGEAFLGSLTDVQINEMVANIQAKTSGFTKDTSDDLYLEKIQQSLTETYSKADVLGMPDKKKLEAKKLEEDKAKLEAEKKKTQQTYMVAGVVLLVAIIGFFLYKNSKK